MNFNIFNSLILAGILQGIIFGFVVAFSKKYNAAATRFLAALIVVFSLNNLQYYLNDIGLIDGETFFSILFVPYQLLVAPLLLFYGLKMLYPDKKLSVGNKLVLIPFGIGLLLTTTYKILFAFEFKPKAVEVLFDPMQGLIEFSSIILYQSVLMYLYLQVLQVENGQSHRFTLSTRIEPLNWFKNILIVFFVVSFMWVCVAVLSYVYDYVRIYYVIWLTLSVLIYWLGYVGIYKFGIQQERKQIRNYSIKHAASPIVAKQKNEHILALENLLVGQKRFLDATITLDKIADELHLSKSHLSRIINNELKIGFPDYLNKLRVEEAKIYLNHPDFLNYTLVAIGLESGFNSKSTFNNAFKKVTGQTPSEFKKSGGMIENKDFEESLI